MKTFRIHASYQTFLHLDVQADTKEEALKIAQDSDGSEWVENSHGDWDIDQQLSQEIPPAPPELAPII